LTEIGKYLSGSFDKTKFSVRHLKELAKSNAAKEKLQDSEEDNG
jgi:hypothetical protein